MNVYESPRGVGGSSATWTDGAASRVVGRATWSFKIGAPSRRRTAPVRATFRTREKIGEENGQVNVDTHHLRGGTALSGSPILLQLNGLVSSLPFQMRAGTSHDRYHHSWAHPAILSYIKTCTTSRWRIMPSYAVESPHHLPLSPRRAAPTTIA